MSNFKNFTPHPFNFYSVSDCIFDAKSRKFILQANESGEYPKPNFTVTPEPTLLRGTTSEIERGEFCGVPQVDIILGSCDPVPPLADGEIALVSFMYMSAAKLAGLNTSRLRTTVPCYKAADGLPFGVVKLAF